MSKIYKPFLKRVGWKRQLLDQFQPFIKGSFLDQNNKNCSYYEAFLWWWAVFFYLRNLYGCNFKAILGDINEELINTYQVVKEFPEKLIQELSKYQYNKDFFLEIRSRDQKSDFSSLSPILRAARFIYLNKTCFNGMYRVNGKGFFNVPFWKYANPLICDEETLFNCSEALQNTTLIHGDYHEVLKTAKKGDFIYLDPPYDVLSQTSNFTDYTQGGFWWKEQEELWKKFKNLTKKGCQAMLSNHNTDRIQKLYSEFYQHVVQAKRYINSNAEKRGNVEEIVVLNYKVE